MTNKKDKVRLTPGKVLVGAAFSVPCGALFGGIMGSFGKAAVSLFNPAVANAAGTFVSFAGMGAIAAPLIIIPRLITDHFLNKSAYLASNPNLKSFLQDTTTLLLNLAAVATAAAIIGSPIGPAVLCMMIIPAAIYLLSTICNVVNACLYSDVQREPEEDCSIVCSF